MSLIDAPIALLDRILAHRSPPVQADDPIGRMVARIGGRLRPEQRYERRLRGRVVNHYVAMREGMIGVPRAGRREMGALGRAVLYASFATAVSVTAVGAASASSLPGDALYPVKREIEDLRIEIAPPSARPALAAEALEERLSEVEQLAAAGRWTLVATASANAEAAEDRLLAMTGSIPAGMAADLKRHEKVLAGLLVKAPASARPGLQHALAVSTATHGNGNGQGSGGGGAANGNNGEGNGNSRGNGNGSGAASPGTTTTPQPTREPSASPRATHSPKPAPSDAPSPPSANPTPLATHSPG